MSQARSINPTQKRARRWLLVGLATCLAAGLLLAGFMTQRAPASGDLQSFTEHLDRDEARWLAATEVQGASVALVRNGEMVWSNGYGHADAARGVPVTAETVFQMASISKPVTAWGVMRLAEQGRIDLDAPVETYLSRWHLPASPFDNDGVTVRRLLSHSAGLSTQDYSPLPTRPLPSLEESLAGESGGVNARSGRDDVRITMDPGQQFNYSNGGFTILQLVIEEVTGEDFSAYMQREVLDPLGMSRSTFQWRADMQDSTALGYDDAGQPMPTSLFTERAAGGLYSTATDVARFMAAGMPGPDGEAPGRGVLTPETFSRMTAAFTLPDQMRASLGYEVDTLPSGATGIGHGGSNTGTSTQFLTLPDRGEGIVVLSNSRDYAVTGATMQAWGAWQGTGSPNLGLMLEQDLQGMATTFLVVAGLLTAAALGWAGYLLRAGWAGRRTWLWRPLATRGNGRWIGRAGALTLIVAAAATGWLLPWRAGIASFIPAETHLLTVAVLLSCLVGAAAALTRRYNGSRVSQPSPDLGS
jgi:CubicO group peptidase (beta-lactamase class C family)